MSREQIHNLSVLPVYNKLYYQLLALPSQGQNAKFSLEGIIVSFPRLPPSAAARRRLPPSAAIRRRQPPTAAVHRHLPPSAAARRRPI